MEQVRKNVEQDYGVNFSTYGGSSLKETTPRAIFKELWMFSRDKVVFTPEEVKVEHLKQVHGRVI